MEYHSYMLLIWRPDPQTDWRYVVEFVATGERHTFDHLADVFSFLQRAQPAAVRLPPSRAALSSAPA